MPPFIQASLGVHGLAAASLLVPGAWPWALGAIAWKRGRWDAAIAVEASASAEYRQRATDDELAGAHRYIADLEATLARKDRELADAATFVERAARPATGHVAVEPGLVGRVARGLEKFRDR